MLLTQFTSDTVTKRFVRRCIYYILCVWTFFLLPSPYAIVNNLKRYLLC